MNEDLRILRKIIAKTFRKAKRWCFFYMGCQFCVFVLAVTSIFVELNANLIAVTAFLGVLFAEYFSWRSDCWKSQGESAKRKLEVADGLGIAPDRRGIADWLAGRPKGFIGDVNVDEIEGSEFDSRQPGGPLRVVENTLESAWWSKHESRRMVCYLSVLLTVVVVAALVALTTSISALKGVQTEQSGALVQNVGGIVCYVLVFILSINLLRLVMDFRAFEREAEGILRRCKEALKSSDLADREALALMHDYQTARGSAPLLPTIVWRIHRKHLREQWVNYRPKD